MKPKHLRNEYYNSRSIFYLHIPKTAGTVINSLFSKSFTKESVATHIESQNILKTLEADEIANKYSYLSGHIPYPQASSALQLDDWLIFSTFRKPEEHVVSHIAWVRLLTEKGHEERLKKHELPIKRIANYIKTLDLSKPEDLVHMIQWLENNNYYLFHNTQTRYLSGGKAQRTISPYQLCWHNRTVG